LNPEGLAELGSDSTGQYIIEKMASQVTVLKIYHPNRGGRMQRKNPPFARFKSAKGRPPRSFANFKSEPPAVFRAGQSSSKTLSENESVTVFESAAD